MNDRVLLEEMTWPQVRAALDSGVETVIIPTASVEQHGPHLPLLTDTLIGGRVAEMVARKLGKTLVAPVVRPGLSSHHMHFAGSFTTSPETFRTVIEEACMSLATHGFKTCILTSGHGGNFSYIDGVSPYLQDSLHAKGFKVRILPHVNLLRYSRIQQDFLGEKYGVPLEEAGFHADVIETACMLVIRPDLVDMSKAAPGYIGDSAPLLDRVFVEGIQSVTSNGIVGDPRRATREMGEALLEHLTDVLAGELRGRLGWS
jgi:creatinine amidohydrolase